MECEAFRWFGQGEARRVAGLNVATLPASRDVTVSCFLIEQASRGVTLCRIVLGQAWRGVIGANVATLPASRDITVFFFLIERGVTLCRIILGQGSRGVTLCRIVLGQRSRSVAGCCIVLGQRSHIVAGCCFLLGRIWRGVTLVYLGVRQGFRNVTATCPSTRAAAPSGPQI